MQIGSRIERWPDTNWLEFLSLANSDGNRLDVLVAAGGERGQSLTYAQMATVALVVPVDHPFALVPAKALALVEMIEGLALEAAKHGLWSANADATGLRRP